MAEEKKVWGESIKIGNTQLSVTHWFFETKKVFVDTMEKAFADNPKLPVIDLDNAWLRIKEAGKALGLSKK